MTEVNDILCMRFQKKTSEKKFFTKSKKSIDFNVENCYIISAFHGNASTNIQNMQFSKKKSKKRLTLKKAIWYIKFALQNKASE